MHPETSSVVVRPVASDQDCLAVVELTGSNFPEECGTAVGKGGAGLNLRQWSDLEFEDLRRQPWIWSHIGLAVEQTPQGDKVLGAVVLSFENQKDGTLSYWEISKRVGWQATVHNYLYEQVLEEPLEDHECLVDFIAVSPDSRGKGVGARLMAWAETTGADILRKQWPEAVAAHGPLMSLWVAADNSAALKLYTRFGYRVTRQTDDGVCHCIMSRLLNAFLGHPVWYKMSKPLDQPPPAPPTQPPAICIPLAVPAAAAPKPLLVAPGIGLPATLVAAPATSRALSIAATPAVRADLASAAPPAECTLRIPAHKPNPAVALPSWVVHLVKGTEAAPLLPGGGALGSCPPLSPDQGDKPVPLSSGPAVINHMPPRPCSTPTNGGAGGGLTHTCSSGAVGMATTATSCWNEGAAPAPAPAPLLLQQLVATTLSSSVAAASLAATVVGTVAAELEGACAGVAGPMSPAMHAPLVPPTTAAV